MRDAIGQKLAWVNGLGDAHRGMWFLVSFLFGGAFFWLGITVGSHYHAGDIIGMVLGTMGLLFGLMVGDGISQALIVLTPRLGPGGPEGPPEGDDDVTHGDPHAERSQQDDPASGPGRTR